jgi:hypothetical protein
MIHYVGDACESISSPHIAFLCFVVSLSSFGTSATVWPIVPALDDDECGAAGGMIGRGNRSARRKPDPVKFVYHKPHMTSLRLET